MKKFICLLALIFTTPFAFAMDMEFGGQHRARGVYYQQDMENIFKQRFKFSGSFRPNEMFESHFWLMTNYNWGDTNYSDNEVRFYGYGDWKVSDEFTIRLGRAPYQIADGSSVGMNDYEEFPYVFDGAFISYNTESLAVDVWGAYLPKAWVGSNEVETYEGAVGVSLDVRSLPEEFKMANLHGVYAMGAPEEDGSEAEQHIRLGLGIGGDISGLDYKLAGALHGDSFDTMTEYGVDAQVGYTLDFDARIYVGGHYESENYNPFYYDRHSRAGNLDVAQWGNGTIYGEAGIAYMPSEDFEIGVVGLYFHKVGKDSWGQWGNGGVNPDGDAELSTDGVIEADVYVKKSYAGGFAINIQGGFFDLTNADAPYWQLQLNTTFDF